LSCTSICANRDGADVHDLPTASVRVEPARQNQRAQEMIEYMKGHEGVWFATGIEIVEWWLKQNFSEKAAPLRMAAAS
jgi:hypothetical protein